MRGLDYGVSRGVYQFDLLLRVSSPEDEDDRVCFVVDLADDGVREILPALAFVGIDFTGADGEDGVEHQDALLRPGHKVAVVWNAEADVVLQLLKNVFQRRGRFDARPHGEAEAVRLIFVRIRVLP